MEGDEPAKLEKPAHKKTKDFGISKPKSFSDGITPQTKVEDYLRSNTPVGFSDDFRSSRRPKTPKDFLERSPSSLKIEEDGRARSRTGFTPPIDVESEKFIESVTKEIEKAEKRSGTPPLNQRSIFPPLNDPLDNYSRKYNPIKAEFTTYTDKPKRPLNPYLSEPNIAAAVSNMLDTSGPPYRSPIYDRNKFRPIDEDFSLSGSLGRVSSARNPSKRGISPTQDDYYGSLKNLSSYDKPSTRPSNLDRYLSLEKPLVQFGEDSRYSPYQKSSFDLPISDSSVTKDSNPLKWENDDLKKRLRKQEEELSRLQTEVRDSSNFYPDTPRSSRTRPSNNDYLIRENEILKKRLDDQQAQIDKLKREVKETSQNNLYTPYSDRYDSMPDLSIQRSLISGKADPISTATPNRSVKFFDDDFGQQTPPIQMDSSNANAIRNADKILEEIDQLISSAKSQSKTLGSDGSAFSTPLSSNWKSTYTGSAFQPSKVTTSFDKTQSSVPSSSISVKPPYNKTIQGGIPTSPLKASFGFDFASSKQGPSGSTNVPNTTYDNDHLRKVADVKARLEAEARKQERLEAAMKEIHDRRSNGFNSTVTNPPIICSRPLSDPPKLVRPIPRMNYGTNLSPRSSNIGCQVYAMDDELEDKGKSPGASRRLETYGQQYPKFDYYSPPVFDQSMNDYEDDDDIYPKEPVPRASEKSLEDFRQKTKGLIERQHQISENILKKFKELDLMLPSSSDRIESNDYDRGLFSSKEYPSTRRVGSNYPYTSPPQQTSSRGLSSWDTQFKSAPRPNYTRRYDSGGFSMRKPNDPWKKSIQKPWSRQEERDFKRSLSPLVMDYERNGAK